jgi:hypothetical protein
MVSPPSSQLRGWKEIAGCLRVSERSAKRWEATRGLPIHRVPGAARDAVFALSDELDAWLRRGGANKPEFEQQEPDADDAASPPADAERRGATERPRRSVRAWVGVGAGLGVVLVFLAVSLWLRGPATGARPAQVEPASPTQVGGGEAPLAPGGPEWLLRVRLPERSVGDFGLRDGTCGGFTVESQRWVQLCAQPWRSMLRLDIRVYPFRGPEATPAREPATNVLLLPDSEVLVREPVRLYVEWVAAPPTPGLGATADEGQPNQNGSSRQRRNREGRD